MLESDFYRTELLRMREKYQRHPLADLELTPPAWMEPEDPMSELYSQKTALLQQGKIVYAAIVQANMVLFRRIPPFDCPAQIVYSAESYFSEHPEDLYEIAMRIYRYKGLPPETVPDEWKELARVITDEYDRSDFTLSLYREDQSFAYSLIPTMIHRKLLPRKRLCGSMLPVLTVPDCKQVMILPKRYWTRAFTKAWVEGII